MVETRILKHQEAGILEWHDEVFFFFSAAGTQTRRNITNSCTEDKQSKINEIATHLRQKTTKNSTRERRKRRSNITGTQKTVTDKKGNQNHDVPYNNNTSLAVRYFTQVFPKRRDVHKADFF